MQVMPDVLYKTVDNFLKKPVYVIVTLRSLGTD
jgi:hypothetical protein